ncbi:uncharacterized protein LAJ45_07378 [Morchella importuna]|uniref:uncharacterized protein n=1 Tax=Morchella importuna TaxID=1174673 RepID=UPI001E8CA9B0|nr:uncharacterized protein LAJ45_07378 [Morchella importuna]KAH8148667.1 hypothetical protein LAJ45_07378 [Morchella importuna]
MCGRWEPCGYIEIAEIYIALYRGGVLSESAAAADLELTYAAAGEYRHIRNHTHMRQAGKRVDSMITVLSKILRYAILFMAMTHIRFSWKFKKES